MLALYRAFLIVPPHCSLAQKRIFGVTAVEGQTQKALGPAQGLLHLRQALQKGFWCPAKGLTMDAPGSSSNGPTPPRSLAGQTWWIPPSRKTPVQEGMAKEESHG